MGVAALALVAASGCGDQERESPEAPLGGISASDTEFGESEDDDAASDDDDDEQKLDTPPQDSDGPMGGDEASVADGCKKVDLLFVIDNSGSMADEQANLIASFPGFIDAMRDQLDDTEGYNVGVTTSDLYLGSLDCLQEGALVTSTLGVGSSNRTCSPYVSGKSFMTEEDDLASTFACAAQVGTEGDGNERPMQTLLAAVSPALNAPGACNDGFVRDDALLVIVIITDEEDDHEAMGCMNGMVNTDPQSGSMGEPDQWYDAVVQAKGGDERSVVVLSLVGPAEGEVCPELQKCDGGIDGAEVTHRIIDFTERFTYGFVGPVCQPYGPFFSEAISSIKSACDDFVPQG